MRHLQELVITQGTVLDRIDYNIDSAVDKVQAGIKELEAAEKTQKDGTAMKCIFALMCLVFVLILAMVIKHSIIGFRR
jgi:syntaxin 16